MAASKGTSSGASAISNISFLAASNHNGMASSMYHKSDMPQQEAFKDSTLLSGLQ